MSLLAGCGQERREAASLPGARAIARTRYVRRCRAAAEENRGELEACEWALWRPRLLWLLGEMWALLLEMARSCTDRERALDDIAGRECLSAVKSLARADGTLRRWLLRAHSVPWPTFVHFVGSVRAGAAEPCGPTMPKHAVRALAWTERAAGVGPNARLVRSAGCAPHVRGRLGM
ncbi:unnamed protein product [Prorocentrum cordatum]|uniref:Uncharacterized protein n=1 Tax=Prorocentrum cordatum TaxID=2364126 RepID=A0ABN9SQJ5_9DINO|nr:unnamed protein product [Polarella glacialis]